MNNENMDLLKCVIKFLSFFNLNLPAKDNGYLLNYLFYNKKLPVLNNDKTVGGIIKTDDCLLISCNDDFKLNANVSLKKEKLKKICFCLEKENTSLNGYVVFKNKNNSYDGLYEISCNNELINKINFSTFGSYVNFHDFKTKESVNFGVKNANCDDCEINFNHYRKKLNINVSYDSDYLYYIIRKFVEKTEFQGYDTIIDDNHVAVGYPYSAINTGVALKEFEKIFQEYDSLVFDFINSIKEKLNSFTYGLYENTFKDVLSNLGDKSIKNIFGLEGLNDGLSYKKNYR